MDLQRILSEAEETLMSSTEEGMGRSSSSADDGRFIWTRELHWEFAVVVEMFGGPQCAIPSQILTVLDAPGLTRHKVASHLQKYRAQIIKEQGSDHQVHGSSDPCSLDVVKDHVAGPSRCGSVDVYCAPVIMNPSPSPPHSCLMSQAPSSVAVKPLRTPLGHDFSQTNMNSNEKGGHMKQIKRKWQHEDDGDNSAMHPKKKKERFLWSPNTHRKFVSAVELIGIEKAMPMKILEAMEDDRLDRHVIASHLQKYRKHLRNANGDGHDQDHFSSTSVPPETLHRQEEHLLNNMNTCNNGYQQLQDTALSNLMQPQEIGVTNHQAVAIHEVPTMMTENIEEIACSFEDASFPEFDGSYDHCFGTVQDFEKGEVDIFNHCNDLDLFVQKGEELDIFEYFKF